MELSYALQTLEPLTGALDIIRYFGTLEGMTAETGEIQRSLGLSDRSFDKAIRRLVTKGYVQMDGSRVYRLTEQGQRAVEELAAYDQSAPADQTADARAVEGIARRLILILPRPLVAGRAASVVVGFNAAADGKTLSKPADLLLRLSVVNGQPASSKDEPLELWNDPVRHTFTVTPGAYSQMRLRLEVFQMDPYSGDLSKTGGMYVDADVAAAGSPGEMVAYGADITVVPVE